MFNSLFLIVLVSNFNLGVASESRLIAPYAHSASWNLLAQRELCRTTALSVSIKTTVSWTAYINTLNRFAFYIDTSNIKQLGIFVHMQYTVYCNIAKNMVQMVPVVESYWINLHADKVKNRHPKMQTNPVKVNQNPRNSPMSRKQWATKYTKTHKDKNKNKVLNPKMI